ncbi:MAG TPA: hypothetical protein PLE77_08870 [Kiritimatiellia bacterium]|nr:hypothetical protein [Kiritimatiellia bacterium]
MIFSYTGQGSAGVSAFLRPLFLQGFGYVDPQRALAQIRIPKGDGERAILRGLLVALKQLVEPNINSLAQGRKTRLCTPEMLRALHPIYDLLDLLSDGFVHCAL